MKIAKEESAFSAATAVLCRLCLSDDASEYMSIYDEQDGVTIFRIIIDCVGIKVRKNDGLTQDICIQCYNELVKFDQIRKKCIESDKILRKTRKKNRVSRVQDSKRPPLVEEKKCTLSYQNGTVPAIVELTVQQKRDFLSEGYKHTQPEEAVFLSTEHGNTDKEEYEIQYLEETQETSETELMDDHVIQAESPVHPCWETRNGQYSAELKHNDSAPDNKSKYVCCGCPSSQFDSEEQLHAHRDEQHKKYRISDNSIRPLECDICYQRFLNAKLLNHHKERPYRVRSHVCKSCGLGYFTSCALRRHEKVCRIVEKNFSCEECGKRFRQLTTLKNHRKLHLAEKAFSCGVCGKTFKKKFEISIHMVTHTTEQPFPCDHCPARFKRKQALKSHQRHHTNARPYKCDMCEEWFNSFAARKFHRQTVHEGLDPFRCEQCGGSYGRRLRLIQHMKKAHSIDLRNSKRDM